MNKITSIINELLGIALILAIIVIGSMLHH